MYKAVYDIKTNSIVKKVCDVDDAYLSELSKHQKTIDKYIYLLDLYHCVLENRNLYLSYQLPETELDSSFWNIIQLTQNYVNSVVCFKEFLRFYDNDNGDSGPVFSVQDSYYKAKQWVRFVYEYRNLVIHSAAFPVLYNPKTKDIYLSLTDLIELAQKSRQKNKKWTVQFWNDVYERSGENDKYLIRDILKKSSVEIDRMFRDEVKTIFVEYLYDSLDWFLREICKDKNGRYECTVIAEENTDHITVANVLNHPVESIVPASIAFNDNSLPSKLIFRILGSYKYSPFLSPDLQEYNNALFKN